MIDKEQTKVVRVIFTAIISLLCIYDAILTEWEKMRLEITNLSQTAHQTTSSPTPVHTPRT